MFSQGMPRCSAGDRSHQPSTPTLNAAKQPSPLLNPLIPPAIQGILLPETVLHMDWMRTYGIPHVSPFFFFLKDVLFVLLNKTTHICGDFQSCCFHLPYICVWVPAVLPSLVPSTPCPGDQRVAGAKLSPSAEPGSSPLRLYQLPGSAKQLNHLRG